MPAVICLAGTNSPEKKIVINSLIAEFNSRKITLGIISNPLETIPKIEFSLPHGVLHLSWAENPSTPIVTLEELIARHFYGVDLVLSEFKSIDQILIEIVSTGEEPTLLANRNLKALVFINSEEKSNKLTVPFFNANQIKLLVDYLIKHALSSPSLNLRPNLCILENGQRLPTNHFVQKIISSTIRAMINTLKKKRDSVSRLEIHIY